MSKLIGLIFLILLVGTSVVAWSRSTATGPHEAQRAIRAPAFSTDAMHTTAAVRALPAEKTNDMSFVFSDER
jgi:hypothetical protein